jgi:hypothetical protein
MIRSLLAMVAAILAVGSAQGAELEAGTAKADITPPIGFPMWGYAARHDKPSVGVLDPLLARALVLKAGEAKIALVGLDLGRAPTRDSIQRIRDALKKDGFTELFLVASHTHHGPVLELSDQEGKGKGKFDAALHYYKELEDGIVGAILEAEAKLVPARLATGVVKLDGFNRNRQTQIEPKSADRDLTVMRLDDTNGKPVAVIATIEVSFRLL